MVKTSFCLILFLLFVFCGNLFSIPLSSCQFINANNTAYEMNVSLSVSTTTCITINGTNNTIDCNNSIISGNDADGARGIWVIKNNTLIKNCIIVNMARGIQLDGAHNTTITNTTITQRHLTSCSTTTGRCNGIFLNGSKNTSISNSWIEAYQYGINLLTGSDGNNITNTTILTELGYPVYLTNSQRNRFDRNTMNTTAYTINTGVLHLATTSNANNFTNNTITNKATTSISTNPIYIAGGLHNRFIQNKLITYSPTITAAIKIPASQTNNTFSQNNITAPVWWDNAGGTTNVFNLSTVGNIYYFPSGAGVWTVYNLTAPLGSVWATNGTGRPINSTIYPAYIIGTGQDFHPFTAAPNQNLSITITNHTSATGAAWISLFSNTETLSYISNSNGSSVNISCSSWKEVPGTYDWVIYQQQSGLSANNTITFTFNQDAYYKLNCSICYNNSICAISNAVIYSMRGTGINLTGNTSGNATDLAEYRSAEASGFYSIIALFIFIFAYVPLSNLLKKLKNDKEETEKKQNEGFEYGD